MKPSICRLAIFALSLAGLACGRGFGQESSGNLAARDSQDPILRAMLTEMERSKAKLKLEDMQAPYFIDYRLVDTDQYGAEAAFGALRSTLRVRVRMLRVVVRVGDYKQDSYYGPGEGVVDIGPLDDDPLALRHQLWWATDRAYKAATEALTSKRSELKQYKLDQPVDDFAQAPPLDSIAALVRLDFDPQPWLRMLEGASALYQSDPQVESLDASLRFTATNRYLVNSEGTVVRNGDSIYQMTIAGHTQAADGMRLDRSRSYEAHNTAGLPSGEKYITLTSELLATLKQLREAPVSEEEYRGPVLFSGDAAATVIGTLVGPNVLGKRPRLGQNGRTLGAWATSYKSRVLPDFLSLVDDPAVASFDGQELLGHYEVDDEGVKAGRVSVVEKGQLVNYLMSREPIRDFPASNGHGRAGAAAPPGPALGNLIVESSAPLSREELRNKLIEMCKQHDLPYGYFVETLGPRLSPRLLYRISTKDGHEELVRGAVFGDLDTRALRNSIVAAGKEATVENHIEPVAESIASPALLFDELEIKRADTSKQKLPEYPPPPLPAK